MTTVEIEAVTSAALTRQPSIGGAPSIRSFRHSLHRTSSRATLPERGERMLEELARDNSVDDDDDNEYAGNNVTNERYTQGRDENIHHQTVPPSFVLGEEVDPPARSDSAQPNVVRDSSAPEHDDTYIIGSHSEGRRSLEGRGWKQAV
jgi:hypothetical protein